MKKSKIDTLNSFVSVLFNKKILVVDRSFLEAVTVKYEFDKQTDFCGNLSDSDSRDTNNNHITFGSIGVLVDDAAYAREYISQFNDILDLTK